MRAKWSAPIRKYWKISEQMMVKYCDLAICDSVNIEKYIHECYDGKGIKGRNPKTTFIAYGADLTLSKLSDDDEKLVSWYKENGLTKKGYYLVVGRFVPENSFEVMIREFMKSKSKKDFAIITNVNERFLNELEEKLHFKSDKRIKFVGTVYDQELLKKIRENAYDLSPCILPGGAEIGLGGHAVLLFEGAEKVVVAPKAACFVDLGDGQPLLDQGAAAVQPGFYDVAVHRLPGLPLELPGDMLPGNKKFLFQPFQCQLLGEVGLDKKEHLVQHQVVAADLGFVALGLDAGAQHQHYKHLQDAVLKQRCTEAVLLTGKYTEFSRQVFQQHIDLVVGAHSNLAEGDSVEGAGKVGLLVREFL